MNLSSEDRGDARIVTILERRIDSAGAIQFKDAVRGATSEGPLRVVLDLGQVRFVDSSGLGAIVSVMKLLGPDRVLQLAALNPDVDKVFRLTRMDTVFAIFDTVDDAFPPQQQQA